MCLNHGVSSAIEITPKDDKTWLWSAGDYSEGEIEYMQFACRFKTPEIANEFKSAVDDACRDNESDTLEADPLAVDPLKTDNSTTSCTASKKESLPDIEVNVLIEVVNKYHTISNCNCYFSYFQVVYEAKATEEEKKKAEKLMLPENFFAYKNKPDCPGCRGCTDNEKINSEPVIVKANNPPTTASFSFGTTTVSNQKDSKINFGEKTTFFGGNAGLYNTLTKKLMMKIDRK